MCTHICVYVYIKYVDIHIYSHPSLLLLVKCEYTATLSAILFDSRYILPCNTSHGGLSRAPLFFIIRVLLCVDNHSPLLMDIFLLSSPLLLQIEL